MVWSDQEGLRRAVAASGTYSEVLIRLELRPAGGNFGQLKRYIAAYGISTDHFDANEARAVRMRERMTYRQPLSVLLVEGSTYHRRHLKRRLYDEGLKERHCELCGQGEEWRGARMTLILDHINGVADDNRLENLRIVCPNCNATLDTHCGRNARVPERACEACGGSYQPGYAAQRFCSAECGYKSPNRKGDRLDLRRVERPPYNELLAMLEADGYEATGRRFGVSGNAVRKWRMAYEREQEGPAAEAA